MERPLGMKPGRIAYVTCPRCRALNEHGMAECFLCEMNLAGLRADVPSADSGPRFRLATLMIVIAGIAVVLAIWRAQPWLAALMLLPGTFALVRVFVLSSERYGHPPSRWEYLGAFVVTFMFVVLMMVSSVVAFLATCFVMAVPVANATGVRNDNVAVILAVVAALAVPVSMLIVAARRRGTRFRGYPPKEKGD